MERFCNKRLALLFVIAVLPFLATGCSKFVEVEGTILVDGEPVEGIDIEFAPAEQGQAAGGMGFTDAKGHYEMHTSRHQKGILPGSYIVRITPPESDEEDDEDDGPAAAAQPRRYPARYDRKSELTAEVSRSNNVFDFEIDTTTDE